jgi:hypothetical protein
VFSLRQIAVGGDRFNPCCQTRIQICIPNLRCEILLLVYVFVSYYELIMELGIRSGLIIIGLRSAIARDVNDLSSKKDNKL